MFPWHNVRTTMGRWEAGRTRPHPTGCREVLCHYNRSLWVGEKLWSVVLGR